MVNLLCTCNTSFHHLSVLLVKTWEVWRRTQATTGCSWYWFWLQETLLGQPLPHSHSCWDKDRAPGPHLWGDAKVPVQEMLGSEMGSLTGLHKGGQPGNVLTSSLGISLMSSQGRSWSLFQALHFLSQAGSVPALWETCLTATPVPLCQIPAMGSVRWK